MKIFIVVICLHLLRVQEKREEEVKELTIKKRVAFKHISSHVLFIENQHKRLFKFF